MSLPEEPSPTEVELQYYWSKFPDLDRSTVEFMLKLSHESSDVYHQYFTDNNDAS